MECTELHEINFLFKGILLLFKKKNLLLIRLNHELNHDGVRGVLHKLFSNYLHNRMQCTKIGLLNLHTKRYLVGSLEVVSLCLYFYIFTSMISFFKLLLFKLLYLLMLLTFVICTTPILIFLRQLSTLNNVKLTTGLGPTNFLPLWRPVAFGDFRKKTPPKCTWLCVGISPLLFGLRTWLTWQVFKSALEKNFGIVIHKLPL